MTVKPAIQTGDIREAGAMTWSEYCGHFEMTRQRAETIRVWRCDEGYSLRGVAQAAFDAFGGDWDPPESQVVGIALCQGAAEVLGEDASSPEWN